MLKRCDLVNTLMSRWSNDKEGYPIEIIEQQMHLSHRPISTCVVGFQKVSVWASSLGSCSIGHFC